MSSFHSTTFDCVARSYDWSVPPLPHEYIELIRRSFDLKESDTVVDLGCGSGLLTFALAQFSSRVQGLDSSPELIRIARQRDVHNRIDWIVCPIEIFDFVHDHYKLIISFEAFHLFQNPVEVIRKCALALKPGGFFCVGWMSFEWEVPLFVVIRNVFAEYGINWGEEANLARLNLSRLVEDSNADLSPVTEEAVALVARSHIKRIATYLASTQRALALKAYERELLADELELHFRKVLSSEWIEGMATYSIAYSRKVPQKLRTG